MIFFGDKHRLAHQNRIDGLVLLTEHFVDSLTPTKETVFLFKQQRNAVMSGRLKVALAVVKPLSRCCSVFIPRRSAKRVQNMRTSHSSGMCIKETSTVTKARKSFDWGNVLEIRLTGVVEKPQSGPAAAPQRESAGLSHWHDGADELH
jgi:hypothetical protein